MTTFVFPAFSLAPMATVRVWVKDGTDSATELYWGHNRAIWNNGGDTATLLNDTNQEVDACTYSGNEPGGRITCYP